MALSLTAALISGDQFRTKYHHVGCILKLLAKNLQCAITWDIKLSQIIIIYKNLSFAMARTSHGIIIHISSHVWRNRVGVKVIWSGRLPFK